jgi:hypothetical protein
MLLMISRWSFRKDGGIHIESCPQPESSELPDLRLGHLAGAQGGGGH